MIAKWLPVIDDERPERGFALWLRALVGRSGAYAIRDADTEEIVYVGMSGGRSDSDGDLYTIIARHFQRSMVRGGRRPAGTYYDRSRSEVAVWLVAPRDVAGLERELIAELEPRDNIRLQGGDLEIIADSEEEAAAILAELEEIPF